MTYEDIATRHGLDADTTRRYVTYMRIRWASTEANKCQDGYASEWAMRFKHRHEFSASDWEGQAILRSMR